MIQGKLNSISENFGDKININKKCFFLLNVFFFFYLLDYI